MHRLTPHTELVLEAVKEINRQHAIAGWYDVRYLIKWLQKKRKPELKALFEEYRDEPDPKEAAQAAIEAYLPSLNQKKMGRIPIEPKGSVVMWKVSAKTVPPSKAPAPLAKARAEKPRRTRGQPWVALIDRGDEAGLRRWLDADGDPNAPGRKENETPLDYAASSGHVKLVRLLLERGARGSMPLREAVLDNRGVIARLILESRVSTLDDLRDARGILRDLVDDSELERLVEKEIRRRRK